MGSEMCIRDRDEKVVSVERLADTGGDDEDGDTGDAPAVEGGEV